ncbi:S-adenosyl-L-methionine-dependent methyltransferase [Schizothecium vesticola]|uniref:S-adenosyl-L-methionine-dependent methyltransferase n=1 Tax=Schizothecium vesticola TaxID=314040 RepID=A0AA40EUG4_9PEZI|nr:S-adenosyl-L-methionine-dependent methyltransferase [Schizothecium vesticola]
MGGRLTNQQPFDEDDDTDTSYGDDASSSTASLSASIFEYRTIHGRTYHSDKNTNAEYWTPNDDRMANAEDIIHHCITLAQDGKLFQAPLKPDIQRVLDVGTGSGIWAIDFADQFPTASVIGTDLSPSQPTWVPPNLKFEIDDATKDWTYPENHFDYIHMRYLFGSIGDWPALLKQAYRSCKPGGYVESFEASCVFQSDDGSLKPGSPMDEWGKVFVEAGRRFGRPFDVVGDGIVEKAFEEAGFEGMTVWDSKCPIGPWPVDKKAKEIGTYALMSIDSDLEGWILYIWTAVMGWSKEEVTVYVAHLRKQLRDRRVHAYVKYRAIYARKPE